MDHALHARNLLQFIRETPVLRSPPKLLLKQLRNNIAAALAEHVWDKLALTTATQLVLKVDVKQLGSLETWHATGRLLAKEADILRSQIGFVDRQIIIALPKMSPEGVEQLLLWLQSREPEAARTILNTAISARVPQEGAERYLRQFRRVTAHFSHLDLEFARTVAHATFMAADPIRTAEQHLRRFNKVKSTFSGRMSAIGTLAREAWRAPRPEAAGQKFMGDHKAVMARLRQAGKNASVSRSLAGMACVYADPLAKVDELAAHYDAALRIAQSACPRAARSIALASCRSPDPKKAARHYVDVYQSVLELANRHDPTHAYRVAGLAFRCDKPLWAARRYLREYRVGSKAELRLASD